MFPLFPARLFDLVQAVRVWSTTRLGAIARTRHPAHLADQARARAVAQLVATATLAPILHPKVLEARALGRALFRRHVVGRDVLGRQCAPADFLDTPDFAETVRRGRDGRGGRGVLVQLQSVGPTAERGRVAGAGHVALARDERHGRAVGERVTTVALGGAATLVEAL